MAAIRTDETTLDETRSESESSLLWRGVVELVLPGASEAGLHPLVCPQPVDHGGQLGRHHPFLRGTGQREQLAGVVLETNTPRVQIHPVVRRHPFCVKFSVVGLICVRVCDIPRAPHPQNLFLATPWLWWWRLWTGWCCCTPLLYTACTLLLSSHLHGWFWYTNKPKTNFTEEIFKSASKH